MRGRLRLRFERDMGGVTRLCAAEQRPPLQVVRAFPAPGGGALVHLHNVSGGVLGGDDLETHVVLAPGARVQLTTTSATRVYRCRDGAGDARQVTTVHVGGGALLEYLPDPLIPFAGARYRQETRVTLAEGAGLFWWEIVAPGREAFGETFQYDRLVLRFDLDGPDRPLARERVRIEPAAPGGDPSAPARLGPYRYFATLYVCRVGEPGERWVGLEAELAQRAAEMSRPGEAVWGVSALPAHGLAIRALSVRGRDLAGGLHAFWQAARCALYGEASPPPRKVY